MWIERCSCCITKVQSAQLSQGKIQIRLNSKIGNWNLIYKLFKIQPSQDEESNYYKVTICSKESKIKYVITL